MTDPRRLKDEYAGDLQGQLLRSVDGDAPRRDARGRTLVALGFGGAALGIPAATTATAATKVGASVTVTMIVKWMGIGVGAAVIAAGTVYEAPKLVGREHSAVTPVEQATGPRLSTTGPHLLHSRSILRRPTTGTTGMTSRYLCRAALPTQRYPTPTARLAPRRPRSKTTSSIHRPLQASSLHPSPPPVARSRHARYRSPECE